MRSTAKIENQDLVDGGDLQKQSVGLGGSEGFIQQGICAVKRIAVKFVQSGRDQDTLKRVVVSPLADLRKGLAEEIGRGSIISAVSFKSSEKLLVPRQLEGITSSVGVELSACLLERRIGGIRIAQDPKEVSALHPGSASDDGDKR